MMDKRIRSMIDEIFSDMKMTAENLALRDELMANAQARCEDSLAQGKSEEEAFAEVAASLEDVYGLLEEMKRMDAQPKAEQPEEAVPELKTGTEDAQTDAQEAAKGEEKAAPQTDLGDALNKAFTALGDFGQAIVPEAKKLYGQMDSVTGGMLGKLGRAAKKGMRDMQKAAGEAIDRLAGEDGKPADAQNAQEDVPGDGVPSEGVPGDGGPDDLEKAVEDARREAERAAQEAAQQTEAAPETGNEPEKEAAQGGEPQAAPFDADGELDEEAFAQAVDEMARDAEAAANEAPKADEAGGAAQQDEAEYTVRDANEPVSGGKTFPVSGLRRLEIQVDADDVEIVPSDGEAAEVLWTAPNADSEPIAELTGHTLTVRRKNPDVFKTFFSVFQKTGGQITVRVPHGYGVDCNISTTSGDVHIGALDVGDVRVNTTSGAVRVEPDAAVRAGDVSVTTVSGHATVSVCAEKVAVSTVSGGQFVSCDAKKVDVNVVSGKVHVEGACDEWVVSAVSSDVELLCTAAPTQKVQISSLHGDVHLALPGDIRGFVAESSGALGCQIVNAFGPDRYGTCALPIRMDTVRGKLTITRL